MSGIFRFAVMHDCRREYLFLLSSHNPASLVALVSQQQMILRSLASPGNVSFNACTRPPIARYGPNSTRQCRRNISVDFRSRKPCRVSENLTRLFSGLVNSSIAASAFHCSAPGGSQGSLQSSRCSQRRFSSRYQKDIFQSCSKVPP